MDRKRVIIILAVALVAVTAAILAALPRFRAKEAGTVQPAGQIFLYGELHGNEALLEKELQLWCAYYSENGMRHLFVELPYYTAEFLNIWMQADDDAILDALYDDWDGTAIHVPEIKDFYRKIKENCPETVFHGTDVGHQYATTGERFLQYLRENGQDKTERYRLAQDAIKQGKRYYRRSDNVYRENAMVANFIQEYDKLGGADIMGIYGSAHTGTAASDYATNTVPCMANQLHSHYGDSVTSKDLTLATADVAPTDIVTIQVGDKEYDASYFGQTDLSSFLPDYQYREFWRLEDAYADFKDNPVTGDVLPYNNYPMAVEEGQVFVIDYTKTDGSVIRKYYRSDGNTWQGNPATEEFSLSAPAYFQ